MSQVVKIFERKLKTKKRQFDIILFLTDVFSHGILLPSALISPHKFNKYHEYLSLRDFFLPQISLIVTNYNSCLPQITQIIQIFA